MIDLDKLTSAKHLVHIFDSDMKLYSDRIEELISTALSDGVLTDKEKQVLFKKAQEEGIVLDEFELVLDARLSDLQKQAKETNTSSKELTTLLSNSKVGLYKKMEIIESFPAPDTKDDLLDFLIALKPKMMDTKDPLSHSYYKKYDECISKAKLLFPEDDIFNSFVSEFPEMKKQWGKQKRSLNRKENTRSILEEIFILGFADPVLGIIMMVIVIAAFIGVCMGFSRLFDSVADFRQSRVIKEQYEDILAAYNNQDYPLAAHLLTDIPKSSEGKSVAKVLKNNYLLDEKLFYALLENGFFNEAKEVAYGNKSKKMKVSLMKALVDNRKYHDAATIVDSNTRGEILEYCIETENFVAGRQIIGKGYYEVFHDYLSKYVINLCQNNKLSEASKIVENNISYFDSLKLKEGILSGNRSEYEKHNTKAVRGELESIINSYRQ